ncbi:MAG: NUDIX hydrolase [Propionibacteriaceae bacterium]|nr:NUDIX hydrolase [Propionibacteriaceae bacterium]
MEHNRHQWTQHQLTLQAGLPGVVVIGRRADGCVALVRHYRPAVGCTLWELPRGMGEPSDFKGVAESIGACRAAAREFGEETGWELLDPVACGAICPDSGILGNRVVIVHGKVGRFLGNPDGETDQLEFIAEAAVLQRLLQAPSCSDGISLAAVLVARSGAHVPG